MKCQHCGADLPLGSSFCPGCGAPVKITIPGELQGEPKYKIKISRPGLNGPARVYKVQVDGFETEKLGVRDEIEIDSTVGRHTVDFMWMGKSDRTVTIELTPSCPCAEIEITLDMLGKLQVRMLSGAGSANPLPGSGGAARRRKPAGCLTAIGTTLAVIAGIFVILVIFATHDDKSGSGDRSSGTGASSSTSATDSAKEPEPPAETVYLQMGYVDNWEISYSGYEIVGSINQGLGSFKPPSDDSKFVVVHLRAKNLGTEKDTFASMLTVGDYLITCKIVSGAYTFDSFALLGYKDDLHQKALNPLEAATGILAFPIPNDLVDGGAPFTLVCAKNGSQAYFSIR